MSGGALSFGEHRGTYLRDQVTGEVARVEGGRDQDLGVLEVLLEDAIRALLVGRYLHEKTVQR